MMDLGYTRVSLSAFLASLLEMCTKQQLRNFDQKVSGIFASHKNPVSLYHLFVTSFFFFNNQIKFSFTRNYGIFFSKYWKRYQTASFP